MSDLYKYLANYCNEQVTWERFVNFISNPKNSEIPYHLIYYLAHIPWHPDIFYTGEPIREDIKKVVLNRIKLFDREITNRLLYQIDEEEDIARGTIGQSIEAIISKVENKKEILKKNIIDNDLSIHIRQLSALLYGYYFKKESLNFLRQVNDEELWIIPEIIKHIKENDWFSIY